MRICKHSCCRGKSVPCALAITVIFLYCIKVYYCPLKTFTFGTQTLLSARRVNRFNYEFIINGQGICPADAGPFLLVFVLSTYSHTDMRQAIRQTWGSPSRSRLWADGTIVDSVRVMFVFGVREEVESRTIPEEESRLYGDVIQADFIDSYKNLTLKTMAALKWASSFCPTAKFIMKSDDDVFVHIPNWMLALQSITRKAFFLGINACHNTVHRSGIWGVSTKDYPFPAFPHYINGYFYAFPGHMASNLSRLAEYVPNLPAEDAVFTGIIRHVLGADLIKNEELFCRSLYLCDFRNGNKAGIGAVRLQEMHELWQSLKKNNKINQRYLLGKYFLTHFFWEKQ